MSRSVTSIIRKLDAMVGLDPAATKGGGRENTPLNRWGQTGQFKLPVHLTFSQSGCYRKKITSKYWPVLWIFCVLISQCFSLIYSALGKISSLHSGEQNKPFSTWFVCFFLCDGQYSNRKHLGLFTCMCICVGKLRYLWIG